MAASGVYAPNLAGCNAEWRNVFSDLISHYDWPESLSVIVDKLSNGLQLDIADGLTLYKLPEIDALGHLALLSKQARFGKKAFFNMNVHINQTNICTLACKFCAFRRGRRADDAYALEIDEYIADLANYAPHVDEVHSVGGLHPDWNIEHYETLFKAVKEKHPHIHIKSLTAVEIKHISKLSNLSFLQTLSRLKKAGLGSLPGGGAEILDDDVREIICKGKESSEEYLEIHRTAHMIGIPTNCTMLFGTIESLEQRLNHMIKLRQLISEKVIACGECVSWAWKYYMTNQHNKRAKVVFGSVQNKWTSKGKRFKHVWIVDDHKHVIHKFTNDGSELVQTIGTYGELGDDETHFNRPSFLDWFPDGSFVVADGYNGTRVVKFDSDGNYLTSWGEPSDDSRQDTRPNHFHNVHGIAVDPNTNRVFVNDRYNHRVQVFDENGSFLDQWSFGPAPSDVHLFMITDDGYLWAADRGTNKILKFDLDGNFLYSWGTWGDFPGGMWGVHGMSVDEDGNFYISEVDNGGFQKYSPRNGANPDYLVGQPIRSSW
mgnify:CR=1 FL=1